MAAPGLDHPVFARVYARVSLLMERAGADEHRHRLLAGLSGRVVEIGAGNGLNFAHYPPEVTSVLAVEPEAHLRELARGNAGRAPVPVEVLDAAAERLPVADGSADAAVAALVLCSVAEQRAVLAELRRVLRPGGQLRFYEHVRADTPGLRRAQRVLDATVWPLLAGGCHLGRDTAAAIDAAGFRIEGLRRFQFPDGRRRTPASTHIAGTAVRP